MSLRSLWYFTEENKLQTKLNQSHFAGSKEKCFDCHGDQQRRTAALHETSQWRNVTQQNTTWQQNIQTQLGWWKNCNILRQIGLLTLAVFNVGHRGFISILFCAVLALHMPRFQNVKFCKSPHLPARVSTLLSTKIYTLFNFIKKTRN